MTFDSGEDIETLSLSAHRVCVLDEVFVLPPGATLVWEREATVGEYAMGKAEFVGIMRAETDCYWDGEVASEPVQLHVVAR